MDFLCKHAYFTINQSAFLRNHSTHTSLHRVVDDWLEAIDSKLITLVCCFDLKKCFDCIDHNVLLAKLHRYGIRGIEHTWFFSYLSERSQATFYQNTLSSFTQITTGVPQGSVLGPILFLLFINDLANTPRHSVINLYADDTLIYVSDEDVNVAASLLQDDINEVVSWFTKNKLTTNVSKTCLIPIGTKSKLKHIHLPPLYANGVTLEWKQQCKYLGVVIDSSLSWRDHIDYVCCKLKPKVGLLSRLRHILPKEQLRMVYMTIIQSVLDYGLTLYGLSGKTLMSRVISFQKRCARLITGEFDINISSSLLFQELDLLSTSNRIKYFLCISMYKCIHGLLPYYLSDNIMQMSEIHLYSTRNELLLQLPSVRTNYMRRSLRFQGPLMWNSLPDNIRRSCTLPIFKKSLKDSLLHPS